MSFMFVCVNFRELAEIGIFVDIWICVFDTCSKWLLVVNDSFLVVSSPWAFIDPAIVLSTFMLPFSFVIVCDLIEQKRNVQVLLIYFLNIYICIEVGDIVSTSGKLGWHWPVYPRHFCVSFSSQDLDFQRQMSWLFVFRELKWEGIVRFVC